LLTLKTGVSVAIEYNIKNGLKKPGILKAHRRKEQDPDKDPYQKVPYLEKRLLILRRIFLVFEIDSEQKSLLV
jgi:hypothetical protein